MTGDTGRRINDEALAAVGLVWDGERSNDSIELWREHKTTMQVFMAMNTQWAVKPMGGVLGLRYEVLPAVLDLLGVKRKKRQEIFAGLRLMERTTLDVLNA